MFWRKPTTAFTVDDQHGLAALDLTVDVEPARGLPAHAEQASQPLLRRPLAG